MSSPLPRSRLVPVAGRHRGFGSRGRHRPSAPAWSIVGGAGLWLLVALLVRAPAAAGQAPPDPGTGALADAPTLPPETDTAIKPGIEDAGEAGTLPPHTTELAKKAATAVSKRDWPTARDAYREMLKADGENPLVLSNLGAVEFQLRDIDNARTHLEQAVRLNPKLARSWVTLGLIYYEADQPLLAVSALTRAIHDEPDNPVAHNYLAVVAKSLGWINAAELELQRAIDLDPKYAEAHFNLSLVYLERNPPAAELARRHYLHARDLGTPADQLVEEQIAAARSKKAD